MEFWALSYIFGLLNKLIEHMRKLLIPVLVLIFITGLDLKESKAQSNWELGIRFPENISLDATIPLAAAPRLHTAIYFERFGIGGYFDWMFALNNGPTGLKFYPGVGPEFFFETQFDFHVAGDFGAEYSFKFPLTLGFDWRPAFKFTNGTDFLTGNWGFIARFRFGEGTSFKKVN